jgi:hypothetical protein
MAKQTTRVNQYGQCVVEEEKPKKVRILDKAAPLIDALNKMSSNVAMAFAHQTRFSYEDFLNLFVAEGERECLRRASEITYSNCGNMNTVHINFLNGTTVRVSLQGMKYLFPQPPALMGLDACSDLELRKRFTDYCEQRQEFAVGFARARHVIRELVGEYDPHVATYLLPSLQLLAAGTTVEKFLVRSGVGTVPALKPMWREACKRVAATITGARLVQQHQIFPTDLEMFVQLEEYEHADLYQPFPGEEADKLRFKVKDTY